MQAFTLDEFVWKCFSFANKTSNRCVIWTPNWSWFECGTWIYLTRTWRWNINILQDKWGERQNSFFKKSVFFRNHIESFFGPPKHVLHLVWSVLGIPRAMNTALIVALYDCFNGPLAPLNGKFKGFTGYWVYNLNIGNHFEIISAEKDYSSFELNALGLLWDWQCFLLFSDCHTGTT